MTHSKSFPEHISKEITSFHKQLEAHNLKWLKGNILFSTLHGSQAYGTSLPTSDVDIKGFCVAPMDYYTGLGNNFEQAELKAPDAVVYDIRKFFKLAAECNPNILEVLFTDSSCWVDCSPLGQKIIDNRHLFLSKKARYTFAGYAHAQLQRINLHYRWLKHPAKEPPTRSEFGLPPNSLVDPNQLSAALTEIKKKMETWDINWEVLEPSDKIEIQARLGTMLAESKLTMENLWTVAAKSLGFDDNFILYVQKEKEYKQKQADWNSYQTWKTTRNPKRAELEEKFGYDCYTNDTEFLTENGWKLYDDVKDGEKLATQNKTTGEIEFQNFSERVKKPYSGEIYTFETRNTKVSVTPNHRMLVCSLSRSKKNKFSAAQLTHDWKFMKAENLLSGNKSYYSCRVSGHRNIDANISLHELVVVGAYVSEGCVAKKLSSGQPSVLRFSQKKGNRQQIWLDRLMSERTDMRRFDGHKQKEELVWTLANRELSKKVVEWCSEYSVNKRLPTWAFQLSSIQANILLDVMIAGDGSNRPYSRIYHTKSPQLAKDTQALALIAGYPSVVWGPYKGDMYQVYIGAAKTTETVIFSKENNRHFKKEYWSEDIVCFTVPNETLITRRHGKPAFQGNTKHAGHLVRLLRMCREILTTGQVLVNRPDAQELLAIRNGAWTYEQVIEWADQQNKELDVLYSSCSVLPRTPDLGKISKLCMETIIEKNEV